jgi:hypothetical protein
MGSVPAQRVDTGTDHPRQLRRGCGAPQAAAENLHVGASEYS